MPVCMCVIDLFTLRLTELTAAGFHIEKGDTPSLTGVLPQNRAALGHHSGAPRSPSIQAFEDDRRGKGESAPRRLQKWGVHSYGAARPLLCPSAPTPPPAPSAAGETISPTLVFRKKISMPGIASTPPNSAFIPGALGHFHPQAQFASTAACYETPRPRT